MEGARRQGLAYARIAGPVVIVAMFAFCSTFGLLVGLTVNTPHPNIESLPVYPNVISVSALTPGRVGSLSTPTMTPIVPPTLLTNFTFDTRDTPAQVVAYYRQVMEGKYGMQVQGGNPATGSSDGVTVLRYGRTALYQNWTVQNQVIPQLGVLERVTISVDSRTPGVTRGTVSFDVLPAPLP